MPEDKIILNYGGMIEIIESEYYEMIEELKQKFTGLSARVNVLRRFL